jgi:hypothetical protein
MFQNLKDIQIKIKSWISNIIALSKQDIKSIWNNTKLLIIPLVLLGVTIKFRDIIINILIKSSKRVFTAAQQKSQKSVNQENQDNQQAEDLINQANNLNKDQPPLGEDWYKHE